MNRRDLLKTLSIGAAAMAFPIFTKEMSAQDVVYSLDELMFWELEQSGICTRVREGKIGIQLRYCFYLKPTSNVYKSRLVEEKRAVQVGTKFDEIFKEEVPVYEYESTGNFINPPLHNHIMWLPLAHCTDSLISSVGDKLLTIVYDYYQKGYFADGKNVKINNTIGLTFDDYSEAKEAECEKRIEELKTFSKWQ